MIPVLGATLTLFDLLNMNSSQGNLEFLTKVICYQLHKRVK